MITYEMQSDSSLSKNHIRKYQEWIVVRRDKVLKSPLWTKSEVGVTSNILLRSQTTAWISLVTFILEKQVSEKGEQEHTTTMLNTVDIVALHCPCLGIAHRYVVLWSQQSWPCHEGTIPRSRWFVPRNIHYNSSRSLSLHQQLLGNHYLRWIFS